MKKTFKEINNIKELREAIGQIKKATGVKRGDISVATRESGFGLSVNIEVKQYTTTAAAAVKAMLKLSHGDQVDDVMTDYFGSNHLSVQWRFSYRELDSPKEWYVSDHDIETVEMVLNQKPDTLLKISDKTSASWHSEPETLSQKGFTTLALYKTEGFKQLTYFTVYDHDHINRVYEFAADLATYRFLNEI